MKAHKKIIVIVVSILLLFAGFMLLRSNSLSRYQPVVLQIQKGILTANKSGIVRLPKSFVGLTPRGEVYAERKPDGRLFVLFPTWYGRGADIEGYLYCSQPLYPSDYHSIDWGSGGVHDQIDVAGHKMLTAKPYKSNWYSITRRLD